MENFCRQKTIFSGKKNIFASPVFTMEKAVFFHWLAKTCQPCRQLSVLVRHQVVAVSISWESHPPSSLEGDNRGLLKVSVTVQVQSYTRVTSWWAYNELVVLDDVGFWFVVHECCRMWNCCYVQSPLAPAPQCRQLRLWTVLFLESCLQTPRHVWRWVRISCHTCAIKKHLCTVKKWTN